MAKPHKLFRMLYITLMAAGFILLTHASWQAEQRQEKPGANDQHTGNKGSYGTPFSDTPAVHQQPDRVIGPNDQSKPYGDHYDAHKKRHWAKWPTLAEGIMIAITLAYAIFACLQWVAIKKAARISHETVAKMNRAWVAVKMSDPPASTRLPEILVATSPISIVYSPYNRGNSLAWVTSVWVKACTLPNEGGLPDKPDYWTEPCSVSLRDCEIVVEPNGAMPSPAYVPADVFRGIYAKQRFLHIYGILSYRDAWGQPHETRFCYCYYVRRDVNDVLKEAFYPVGPKEYNKQT